jgi:hypothetical protein
MMKEPRTMPDRILDLTSGLTMIVSDLHGDREAFARYVKRFLQLRSSHNVERLLLLGDLIHREAGEGEDESLKMVLDVINMQAKLPAGSVIMLLGNHEMPHIYSVSLAKGNIEYTPPFERAMTQSGTRQQILNFFDSLPFYVRTGAGVMFTHAGPDGTVMANMELIRTFDHQAILEEASYALEQNPHPDQLRNLYAQVNGMPYEVLARYYLAVEGEDDPRFDDLVRAYMIGQRNTEFQVLWDALFTRCEQGTPSPLYERLLSSFLRLFSEDAPAPQEYLVTGHIQVKGGHQVVNSQHLRIASATHARPREAGQYLLLDFGTPVQSMDELVDSLDSVF